MKVIFNCYSCGKETEHELTSKEFVCECGIASSTVACPVNLYESLNNPFRVLTVDDVISHLRSMMNCTDVWAFEAESSNLVAAYLVAVRNDKLDSTLESIGSAEFQVFQHGVGFVIHTNVYMYKNPSESRVLDMLKNKLAELLTYLQNVNK